MKKYIYITIIVTICILLFFQFFRSEKKNGFQRNFKKHKFQITKIYELPKSAKFYFAGSSQENFYFKNLTDLNSLFYIDKELERLNQIPLNLAKDLNNRIKSVNIGIADSLIYATENKTGELTLINKNDGYVRHYPPPFIRLDNSFLLSSSSILGRSVIVNGEMIGRQLVKVNYLNGKIEQKKVLEKQVDGYFCTDGILKFDPIIHRIFYMYVYRGEFLCLDTNLNLIYKAKTIDTVTTASIKLTNNTKSKTTYTTQATPPKFVNRNIVLFENNVFILSALKSDNETFSDFKKNQVVDVYEKNDGKYSYSFYIPKYNDLKLRNFLITTDFIIAIFDNYLVKFKMYRE